MSVVQVCDSVHAHMAFCYTKSLRWEDVSLKQWLASLVKKKEQLQNKNNEEKYQYSKNLRWRVVCGDLSE